MKPMKSHVCTVFIFSWFLLNVKSADDNTVHGNSGTELKDVAFLVLTQPNAYHMSRAKEFREAFKAQIDHLEKNEKPTLLMTHKKWPNVLGSWTVFPLLHDLRDLMTKAKMKWLFVCEEETRVHLNDLVEVLNKFDAEKEFYLGKDLRDQDSTVIHHYAFHTDPGSFAYPDPAAGYLMSLPLVTKLANGWPDANFRADFSIDPKHELALFAHQQHGVSLTPVIDLCTGPERSGCVTWYPVQFPDCGPPVPDDNLFVAVKTCEKYHLTRAQFVKETWGRDTQNIEYYSDVEDTDIPTLSLGVPNTERGHCGKTMAMIRRFNSDPSISKRSWYLIADDDTIINLRRLQKLLACYNPKEAVHLGERYGYMVTANNHGYNYITGGGGMIFSRGAIDLIVNKDMASCPSDDAPDDMILGKTFKNLRVPVLNSPYFHQAKPRDYSPDFLSAKTAISFHKHDRHDPQAVYEDLMKEEKDSGKPKEKHEEL